MAKKKVKIVRRNKNGVTVEDSSGKQTTLLNPAGKGRKFSAELKSGKRFTNDGKVKKDKELGCCERAYRAGYLDARSDSAKAYKAAMSNFVLD